MLSPLGFVAIGALGDFRESFARVALPLVAASVAFLLWRYLRAASTPPRRAALLGAVEACALAVVAAFVVVVSGARLAQGAQRVGLAAAFALVAAGLALALVLPRRSALEARMSRIPPRRATALLIVLVLAALLAIALGVATPSRFP